jgi:hypothetical protein
LVHQGDLHHLWRDQFRDALRARGLANPTAMVASLEHMTLSEWYRVQHVGGAIGIAFAMLADRTQVDAVLASWRSRITGHVRLIDSVVFHLVRRGLPSGSGADAWLGLARAEALRSRDPSLLETLVYALGTSVVSDPHLFDAAQAQRRGYSPLHRALDRVFGHFAVNGQGHG